MDEDGEEAGGAVNQQALLPTSRDPRLWLVECKSGTEREVVVSLLQKAHNLASTANPLQIRSVYMVDHLRVSKRLMSSSLASPPVYSANFALSAWLRVLVHLSDFTPHGQILSFCIDCHVQLDGHNHSANTARNSRMYWHQEDSGVACISASG